MPTRFDEDLYQWGDWEEKFAWSPINVTGGIVWGKAYYRRTGVHRYAKYQNQYVTRVQRKTLFDILKD